MRSSRKAVPSTRRRPGHSVSVPILPPRGMLALLSQNVDTEILPYNSKSRGDNAMTERRTKGAKKQLKNVSMYNSKEVWCRPRRRCDRQKIQQDKQNTIKSETNGQGNRSPKKNNRASCSSTCSIDRQVPPT